MENLDIAKLKNIKEKKECIGDKINRTIDNTLHSIDMTLNRLTNIDESGDIDVRKYKKFMVSLDDSRNDIKKDIGKELDSLEKSISSKGDL